MVPGYYWEHREDTVEGVQLPRKGKLFMEEIGLLASGQFLHVNLCCV